MPRKHPRGGGKAFYCCSHNAAVNENSTQLVTSYLLTQVASVPCVCVLSACVSRLVPPPNNNNNGICLFVKLIDSTFCFGLLGANRSHSADTDSATASTPRPYQVGPIFWSGLFILPQRLLLFKKLRTFLEFSFRYFPSRRFLSQYLILEQPIYIPYFLTRGISGIFLGIFRGFSFPSMLSVHLSDWREPCGGGGLLSQVE